MARVYLHYTAETPARDSPSYINQLSREIGDYLINLGVKVFRRTLT